jgi:hypothetical protein
MEPYERHAVYSVYGDMADNIRRTANPSSPVGFISCEAKNYTVSPVELNSIFQSHYHRHLSDQPHNYCGHEVIT